MRLDLYQNINAEKCIEALGIKMGEIERYRGAGVEDGKIVIHCRTGGGNRDSYQNSALTSNKYYIRDEDDDFDCTYATYYFEIPKELKEGLLKTEDKEAKAVYGDALTAIGIMVGDKAAIEKAKENLEKLKE